MTVLTHCPPRPYPSPPTGAGVEWTLKDGRAYATRGSANLFRVAYLYSTFTLTFTNVANGAQSSVYPRHDTDG